MSSQVILLPGGVMPAQLAYADLIAALGSDVEAVAKELEMYAGPGPPPGYTLDTEVDGIRRAASEAGFDRFHLVGYSGGGASSLALAAAHPERAERASEIFPDFTLEVFEERHHFDPPHRIEPSRTAEALRRLWARADPQ